jgi:hypothetical protein
VATLGLVQRDVTEDSFRNGQKVLVDNCVIAEFADYDTCNGRRMFKLRQYYTHRGERLESVHYWPISDLRRLVPTDSSRVPRGQLTYNLSRSDVLLPALEYLFNASKTADLAAVSRRTIVVMPVAFARELAKNLSLHGHRLKDVIPMGHLTEEGVTPWSNRFGDQQPLLIVASDLDAACQFVEETGGQSDLTIVDLQDRNANKTASLRRLQHLRIPTLVVSAERSADQLALDDGKTGAWEWSEDDFESLLWPAEPSGNGPGPLANYERRLQLRSSSEVRTELIQFELADRTFDAVRTVRAFARERGDDHLIEMDEIVSLSYGLMSRLLRCATPLAPAVGSFQEVDNGLRQLAAIRDNCHYLTQQEREVVTEAEHLLRDLFSALQIDNPKSRAVCALLTTRPNLSLICPDRRLNSDLEAAHGKAGTRILAGYSEDMGQLDGAIIPGWFRKDRMASLLMPPVTSPIHLVLYRIEQKWHTSFLREKQRSRTVRSGTGGQQRFGAMFSNCEVRGHEQQSHQLLG